MGLFCSLCFGFGASGEGFGIVAVLFLKIFGWERVYLGLFHSFCGVLVLIFLLSSSLGRRKPLNGSMIAVPSSWTCLPLARTSFSRNDGCSSESLDVPSIIQNQLYVDTSPTIELYELRSTTSKHLVTELS